MNINISHNSGEPIYQQIKEQIKLQILNGQLEDGFALPSIRNLARDLQISVITTKRAYDELEREGLVVSVSGKGTFVSGKNNEALREMQFRMLEEQMKDMVSKGKSLGLSLEELQDTLKIYYKGE